MSIGKTQSLLSSIRYPVRGVLTGGATLESGPGLVTPERVVVIAHYSERPQVSRSIAESVRQFTDLGYWVVVVSTSGFAGPLIWPIDVRSTMLTVLRRRNLGYDFGSWSTALRAFPGLSQADRVLLTNDSLVGPFGSLAPLISDFELATADLWGLTESAELEPHIQSFFVGFHGGFLAKEPLRSFFAGVRVERTKDDVVRRYELGLTQSVLSIGGTVSPHFVNDQLGIRSGDNPTHGRNDNWKKLLEAGFPFLKRSFLCARSADEYRLVAQQVQRIYGENLDDWT